MRSSPKRSRNIISRCVPALALLVAIGLAGFGDDREPVPCPPGEDRVLVKVFTSKGVKRLSFPASSIRQVDRAYSWSSPIEIRGDGLVRVVIGTERKISGERKSLELTLLLFSDAKVRTKAFIRPAFVSPLNFWDAYREAEIVRRIVGERPEHLFKIEDLISRGLRAKMIARCPVCRVVIPSFYYVYAHWAAIGGGLLSCHSGRCYFNAYVAGAVGVAVYSAQTRPRFIHFPQKDAFGVVQQTDRILAEARACAR